MLDWLADNLLQRQRFRLQKEIRARKPLFVSEVLFTQVRYRLQVIGEPESALRQQPCLLAVETDGVHLYPFTTRMDIHVRFPPETLRWFGRPQKYHDDTNLLWLHTESGGQWHFLALATNRYVMQVLVRALKQIATPEQVKAYRRHRPYLHLGPVSAQAAEQDIYGAWTLNPASFSLYLMPIALVMLNGTQIISTLPLEKVQQIEAIPRLDDPDANGVVRFKLQTTDDNKPETHAYAVPNYVEFGAALAEAAKRTLEDPPTFYGKKKDEDWED